MQTIHRCALCNGEINAFKLEDKDGAAIAGGGAVFNQESLLTQIIFGKEEGTKGKTVYTHIPHQCPDGRIGIATLVGFADGPIKLKIV